MEHLDKSIEMQQATRQALLLPCGIESHLKAFQVPNRSAELPVKRIDVE